MAKTNSISDTPDWVDRFSGLSQLDRDTKDNVMRNTAVIEADRGTTIFGPGKSPENMLFLLEGTVRVQQVSETGHEIVLYRIHAGQSCVLTTACLLAHEDYSADGIAETAIKAAAMPRPVFDDLVADSKPFREFVFAAFSKRITDLFLMIDAVAFQRLDVRLADKLIALSDDTHTVATTHQKLSVELGTAREVVSRQLQEFQRRGWIAQARGQISLLDPEQLRQLANHTT